MPSSLRRTFPAFAALALLLVLATGAPAQRAPALAPAPRALAAQPDARAFPLLADGRDAATGLVRLAPDAQAVEALAATPSRARRTLAGLALPGGRVVDLDVQRLELGRLGFGFVVDGLPAPRLLDGLALSVWRGAVAGEPGSEVLLSFSLRGSHGWLRAGGELVHLLPQPSAPGVWSDHRVLLASERELAARGMQPGPLCAADRLDGLQPPAGALGASAGGDGCIAWSAAIAIETDFQLHEVFGDAGAEAAYLATLLAAVSDRYEEQIDAMLTFPFVQIHTREADPWTTPESGGDTLAMLFEFQGAWAGNLPAGADLAHFISGAPLGGGIAYLGVLCEDSKTFTFAVSANIDGGTPLPIAVGPLNWDFMVFAHETGHNFGAPHTHDMAPPVDLCAFGQCVSDGTVMSYCHTCPGGMENITTFFAPESVAVMTGHAGDCLPLLLPLVASASSQPEMVSPFATTPVAVQVQGTPVGPVTLSYRFSPDMPFVAVPMTGLGGGQHGASLPAPGCAAAPEWFFSMVDEACGPYATEVFAGEAGNAITVLHDDCEIDGGFEAGAPDDDATTGLWEHGVPVGSAAQPFEDASPAGEACWFTGQGSPGGGVGENDVDGGKTTLTSQPIDLSGGDARIRYSRWYSNVAGGGTPDDVFLVEVSNGGPWVAVETLGPLGPDCVGGWIEHEIAVSDFVAPSADVRLRFVAADTGSGSIVEAAIDELRVYRVGCREACQPALGYAGPGTSSLSVCGGDLAAGTQAELQLSGAKPGGVAWLLAGTSFAPAPWKGGHLVPTPALLNVPVTLDGTGSFVERMLGGHGPMSLYTQAIYPDSRLPQGWGFSNAVRIDFGP